jgi:hypothetical protein
MIPSGLRGRNNYPQGGVAEDPASAMESLIVIIKMQLLQLKDLNSVWRPPAVKLYRVGGHGETKLARGGRWTGRPIGWGIVLGLKTTSLSKAALERARYVVECLRTRFVREGWQESFDEEGAARTLRYIEGQVAGKRSLQLEEQPAIYWLLDHGQSLGWILRGDPGGMICQCAHHSSRGQ